MKNLEWTQQHQNISLWILKVSKIHKSGTSTPICIFLSNLTLLILGGASCDLESNCLRRTPFHRLHISFPVYASSSCDFSSQYLSWNCQGKECIGKVFFWGHPHPVPDVAVPCDVWRWKEKQIFFHICHNLFLKKNDTY